MKATQSNNQEAKAECLSILNATEKWVSRFNTISQSLIRKAYPDCNGVLEITPDSVNDRVCITRGKYAGQEGEIVEIYEDDDGHEAKICLDGNRIFAEKGGAYDYSVIRDDSLPLWGCIWRRI